MRPSGIQSDCQFLSAFLLVCLVELLALQKRGDIKQ